MKKPIFLILLLCLCLGLTAAAAESVCPVHPLPAPGEIHTTWQLYAGEPVAYLVDKQIDTEAGLVVYTIQNPDAWGLAPQAMTTWQYAPDTALWQSAGDPLENRVVLVMALEEYAQLGFPSWEAPGTGDVRYIRLSDYGFDTAQELLVDYCFDGGEISISLFGQGCMLTAETPETSTFAQYDDEGRLYYGSYYSIAPDQSNVSITIQPDEATQSYPVTDVFYTTRSGEEFYWANGYWTDMLNNPVDAPEGIDLENLPFQLLGQWAGMPVMPFTGTEWDDIGESYDDTAAGDWPEALPESGAIQHSPGIPTAADVTVANYWPYPTQKGVYATWPDSLPAPLMPEVSWLTREDGTVVFTIKGVRRWGVRTADLGSWTYENGGWIREEVSTEDQLTLLCPPEESAFFLQWIRGGEGNVEQIALMLYPDGNGMDLVVTQSDRCSFGLSNTGESYLCYPLDDYYLVEAYYMGGKLDEYMVNGTGVDGMGYYADYLPDQTTGEMALASLNVWNVSGAYDLNWSRDDGWTNFETGLSSPAPDFLSLDDFAPLPLLD